MAKGEILGHIDCPTCGTAKGMRITHDKNGDPFGYCEAECNQQMRIGGDKRRVKAFLARYPWAAGAAPVTDTEPKPAPEPEKAAAPAPAPKPKAPPRNAFDDAVAFLSGGKS
jgi:hypothetical protein